MATPAGDSGIVKRIRIEVEQEVAAWSARPAVIVVEPDEGLRPRVIAAARSGAGSVPVIAAGSEREGMEAVASRPAVLLWLGDGAEIDPARVIRTALRRSPLALVVLRLPSALSGRIATSAGTVTFQGTAERLVAHLTGLVELAVASWLPKLDGYAQELIGERLRWRVPRAELCAIGVAPAAEPGNPEPSEREVLRRLYVQRLVEHDVVVRDAAASLGLGPRKFYRRLLALGVDLPALRRRRA